MLISIAKLRQEMAQEVEEASEPETRLSLQEEETAPTKVGLSRLLQFLK